MLYRAWTHRGRLQRFQQGTRLWFGPANESATPLARGLSVLVAVERKPSLLEQNLACQRISPVQERTSPATTACPGRAVRYLLVAKDSVDSHRKCVWGAPVYLDATRCSGQDHFTPTAFPFPPAQSSRFGRRHRGRIPAPGAYSVPSFVETSLRRSVQDRLSQTRGRPRTHTGVGGGVRLSSSVALSNPMTQ